ncbi:MAG: hypothetical protein Q9M08_06755 [Mariprofundus sp.]|nr:hypothetical protein [Mariprofundus sp.]
MFRKMFLYSLLALFPLAGQAAASSYSYMIDHGTPGVIASNSKMARLILIGSGDCARIPYDIIADGVKSLGGNLDLSEPVSFPLDFTTVTLSCSKAGIKANVSKEESGIFKGN